MSELEKQTDHKQTSEGRLSQGDKKEFICVDLTDNENADLLIVDVECGKEIEENERLSKREKDGASAVKRGIINLRLEDLTEPIKHQSLKVDPGSDCIVMLSESTIRCHKCGLIVDSLQKQCNICFPERAATSAPLWSKKTFTIKPHIYAGIALLVFIALLVYAMQIIREPAASTLPPVPSTPVPVPEPDLSTMANNFLLQDVINNAEDGDVISIQKKLYYGPIDFKGKNLSIVLDENGSGKYAHAIKIAVSGAIITLYEPERIEPLLRSYHLVDDINSTYTKLNYKVQTNYYEYSAYPGVYLVLNADGNNLVISGKASEPGQRLTLAVESGTYKGEYQTDSGADATFSFELKNLNEQEGIRSETVMIDVLNSNKNSRAYNYLFSRLLVSLTFEDNQLVNIMFEKPLAYDGNAKVWNTFRDPSQYLKAEPTIQSQDPKIVELAESLVMQGMSDFQKLVKVHHWVTTNIAYDVKMLASGKRAPQDAVSVLENKLAVCEGYAKLIAALLRSQGISARYISGHALSSHDTGRGWEEEGLYNHPIGHAWNEIYIDGEWLTVDATWNAGYINSNNGEFVFEQSFNYFAPSLEYFSRSHFIPR